jgi:hypothetical protein
MCVELSVDAEFAAPPAAKGLHEEVKVVKAWLEGSELFGSPRILNEGPPPTDTPHEPSAPVDKAAEVSKVIREGVGVERVVCPFPLILSRCTS